MASHDKKNHNLLQRKRENTKVKDGSNHTIILMEVEASEEIEQAKLKVKEITEILARYPLCSIQNKKAELIDKSTSLSQFHKSHLISRISKAKTSFRKVYFYGNTPRYHCHRYLECFRNLNNPMLENSWFEGKDCLDVGCNEGILMLLLAYERKVKSYIGIDLDFNLIVKATKNLRFLKSNANFEKNIASLLLKNSDSKISKSASKAQADKGDNNHEEDILDNLLKDCGKQIVVKEVKKVPINRYNNLSNSDLLKKYSSLPRSFLIREEKNIETMSRLISVMNPQTESSKEYNLRSNSKGKRDEVKRQPDFKVDVSEAYHPQVKFEVKNVFDFESDTKFDTITCFSVIKWVHLTYGDDGIRVLFHKFHNLLRVNGILILETESIKSYKKSSKQGNIHKESFKSIKLPPESFSEYLETKVGFTQIKVVYSSSNSKRGYDKPILVFRKL